MSAKPPVPKIVTQVKLLRLIPADHGLTTDEVFDKARRQGMKVSINGDCQTIDGYPLHAVLRVMRRTGWLLFNKHTDPPVWIRTPTGTVRATAVPRRPAAMTAVPRQEVPA